MLDQIEHYVKNKMNNKIKLMFVVLLSLVIFFAVSKCIVKEKKPMSDNYLKKAEELANAYWGKDGIKEQGKIKYYKSREPHDTEESKEILKIEISSIKDYYEKIYIKAVNPLESEEIIKLINGYRIFEVVVYNPESQLAGPPFFYYSLVIKMEDESAYYFEDVDQIVDFLSDLSLKAENEEDVNAIVSIFALLKRCKFIKEPASEKCFRWEIKKYKSWKDREWEDIDKTLGVEELSLTIRKLKDEWGVSGMLLSDPTDDSDWCYELRITKTGKITIKAIKRTAGTGYS